LIDSPTLAVLQVYRGVSKFYKFHKVMHLFDSIVLHTWSM